MQNISNECTLSSSHANYPFRTIETQFVLLNISMRILTFKMKRIHEQSYTKVANNFDNCNHIQRLSSSCLNFRNFTNVKYTITLTSAWLPIHIIKLLILFVKTNRLPKAEIYGFSTDIYRKRPQIPSKSQPIKALSYNRTSLFQWIWRNPLNRRGKMSGIIIN